MTTQESRPSRRWYALLHGIVTAGVMSGYMAILPANSHDLLKRTSVKVEAPAHKVHTSDKCAPKATTRSASKPAKPAQRTGWANLARWLL